MKIACLIGAIVFDVYSIASQLAAQNYHGVGEDLLAMVLFAFWVVAISPISFCYHWLGLDSRMGSGLGNYHMSPEILIGMCVLNALIGAVMGAVTWKTIRWLRGFSKKH